MPDKSQSNPIVVAPTTLAQETSQLHRLLARAAWLTRPLITVEHDPAADVSTVIVLSAPTAGEATIDPAVFLGLDDPSQDGWPTIITLADVAAHATNHPATAALNRVRSLIGDRTWHALHQMVIHQTSGPVEVLLTAAEAADLQKAWSRLLYQATDANPELDLDDAVIAAHIATWTADLGLLELTQPVGVRDLTSSEEHLDLDLTADLPPDAVQRTRLVAINDAVVFEQIIGRRKRFGEPWPKARVTFTTDGSRQTCTVAVVVPELAQNRPRLVATVTVAGGEWTMVLEQEPAQDTPLSRTLIGYRTIPANKPSTGTEADSVRLKLDAVPHTDPR